MELWQDVLFLVTAFGCLCGAILVWILRLRKDALYLLILTNTCTLIAVMLLDTDLLAAWLGPDLRDLVRRLCGRGALSVALCLFLWTCLREHTKASPP